MISDEYKKLNSALHKENAEYGSGSAIKYEKFVREVMEKTDSKTVLDYGCGKGKLKSVIGNCVCNYDPAIEEWSGDPNPSDLVVCTDVLEHVEPEFLNAVIEHIWALTIKVAFIVISCRAARKTLPDGRNAHLIVESPEWWEAVVSVKFSIFSKSVSNDSLMVLCRPIK